MKKAIEKQVPPRRFTGSVFDRGPAPNERESAERTGKAKLKGPSHPHAQPRDPSAHRAEVLEG